MYPCVFFGDGARSDCISLSAGSLHPHLPLACLTPLLSVWSRFLFKSARLVPGVPCQRCDPYLSFNFRPIYNKPASTAFVLALALFGSSLYLIFFFFFWQTLQYRDIFSWTLSCDHFFWFLFFFYIFLSTDEQTTIGQSRLWLPTKRRFWSRLPTSRLFFFLFLF